MNTNLGLIATISAFLIWGLVPIYWRPLQDIPSLLLVFYRILFSLIFLTGFFALKKRPIQIKSFFKQHHPWPLLSAFMIGANWLLFIHAVNTNQVLAVSLGYYINPLVSVALGMIFLGERPRIMQVLAIVFALCGIVNFVWFLGRLPMISLSLAITFGLYGLFRKKSQMDSFKGLYIECILIMIPILLICFYKYGFTTTLASDLVSNRVFYISLSGIATAIPLILFATGAKNISLSAVGLCQYIAPSLQFLCAIYVFNEKWGRAQLVTFALIWVGLIIYTFDSIRYYRYMKKSAALRVT